MKKIYAVIDFKGVIKLFFILGVFALLSGCFVSADDGYECGLHDMQDEMPGLAMFRGDDPGGSIERAIGNYEHALHQNLDSTAKCNTTDWLEVRCVSIGTLTTTSELHDELYAPHQRGTLPDLGHVAY